MSFLTRITFCSSLEQRLRYFWWNQRAVWSCTDSNATAMFLGKCSQCNQRCLCSACTRFLLKVNRADYVDYVLEKASTCIVVKLSHCCHMVCFTNVPATFLGLGTLQLCCCLWRVRELSDFIIKKKKLAGHQRSYLFCTTWGSLMREFSFWCERSL